MYEDVEIVRKVGKVSFELKMSPSMRVHSVFHASMLKPYQGDLGGAASNNTSRSLVVDTPSLGREIIEILNHRTIY